MFRRKALKRPDRSIALPTTYRVATAQTGQTLAEFTTREAALRFSSYVGRTFKVSNYVQASQ